MPKDLGLIIFISQNDMSSLIQTIASAGKILLSALFLFYFLLPISRESIVFGSNFRNGDFVGFTRFEVS